jgi:hypothetical protein
MGYSYPMSNMKTTQPKPNRKANLMPVRQRKCDHGNMTAKENGWYRKENFSCDPPNACPTFVDLVVVQCIARPKECRLPLKPGNESTGITRCMCKQCSKSVQN